MNSERANQEQFNMQYTMSFFFFRECQFFKVCPEVHPKCPGLPTATRKVSYEMHISIFRVIVKLHLKYIRIDDSNTLSQLTRLKKQKLPFKV